MTFVRWALAVAGATLVGAVGLALMVSASASEASVGVALPLAVAGTVLLGVAAMRERRNRGTLHLRHCLECGAVVAARAGVCPRCSSVRLERLAAEAGGGESEARLGRRAPETREMPIAAVSSDRSGVIGWLNGDPPGAEGFAVDAGAGTKRLRLWGIALWAIAAGCLAFGLFGPPLG